jgi:glyoxylase-like metal-dependent hydrolase (beta-lactamase superfamily II)
LDHSGSVAYAKEITGANILCHEYAAPFIRDGISSHDNAKTQEGRFVNAIVPYQAVEPDIVITTEFDLSGYGIEGRVIPTPGHSQGSITVILDNGEVLVGDLVGEQNGHMNLLTFEDKDVLIQSLETIASYDVRRIYVSHGESIGYVDNDAFQEDIESLK